MSYEEYIDGDNRLIKIWATENCVLHREDGPAKIEYYPNMAISQESFYFNGDYHRKSGAAIVYYRMDGSAFAELFYLHGKFLGHDQPGFWALWKSLTEKERTNPNILKLMLRYI
jgi:hypothetical protein